MADRDVAIIGMACVFPKAPNLAAFWRNVRDGVDAITDVPPERWDPLFYDPSSSAPDRFYAHRGGFIDDYAKFDAAAFGIMPVAAQGAEPDQLMALDVAVAAVADAGYADRAFARDKTSIIIGRGNYLGPGIVRLVNITRGAQQLVDSLRTLLPDLDAAKLDEIKAQFHARCGIYGADTAIGLVPNLVASRIANRLDLGGSAYTIDAACASTLVAVDQACRELRDGEADVAIAGGVHLCHDLAFWSVFSQLGALSRSQQIRPFDRRADGLLIGEGIGMLVLKRRADAEVADDRIYAVIRGAGIASDGRDVSLLTPRVEGQTLALTRAWKAAGLEPGTVGLVEAHGTATAAGDAAELATLGRVFGGAVSGAERIALGSVKSMIGHAMPAAGAAGLIKAALAVYHGVKPPTLHCEEPSPALESTRFRPLAHAEPWEGARRAAVNAFGFGGINAHVILDAPSAPARRSRRQAETTSSVAPASIFAAPSQEALLAAIDEGHVGGAGSWRLAVFDPTPKRMATARAAVVAGRARHGRDGIYFSAAGLVADGGRIAFLFPGVEAEFAPKVDDIADHFAMPRPDLAAPDLEHAGVAIGALNHFLDTVVRKAGVEPDAIAGHSIGEWSGMLASGMVDATFDGFVRELSPGSLEVADVVYVAAGAGAQRLRSLLADIPAVFVSHDNCDHQAILCGPHGAIEQAQVRLRAQRVLFEVLPFRSGFHSPALERQVDYYVSHLDRVSFRAPRVPMWSATTCAPYPAEDAAVRALFRDHLLSPVRFRELVRKLYDEGVRVFVQVGTGSLAAFVDDVLVGMPHQSVSLVSAHHAGMDQLRRAGAALYVEGAPVDLARLGLATASPARARLPLSLALSTPLIKLDLPPLVMQTQAAPVNGHDLANPLLAAFADNMREMAAAHDAVRAALAKRPAPAAPAVSERTDTIVLSAATYPELVDHGLIPQPRAWPVLEDFAPAVPMTMSIALIVEAARRLESSRVAVAVENVQAQKWLRVEPAATVEVKARRVDADRVAVSLGDYFAGTVIFADRYAPPPLPTAAPIEEVRPFPIAADAVYRDGWLFHGPSYQGIERFGDFGSNGLDGTLRALAGKGSLLDNAGQLVGLWMMQFTTSDRLAMPIRVRRIDFFAPEPAAGEMVECTARIAHLGRHDVRADLEVVRAGRVVVRITGWEDWRFFTGDNIFEVMRQPGTVLMAQPDAAGFVVVRDSGWASATLDFLARRFLSCAEVEAGGGIAQVVRRRDWLIGRIAGKDAIRRHLFERGVRSLHPVEITIANDAAGRPQAKGPWPQDLRISIAHKDGVACAIAAQGCDPGIDIEKIDARGEGFAKLAFGDAELRRLPTGDRDEWRTRLWAAKEAAGKAAGTGMQGDPRKLALAEVDGERMRIGERWIATRRDGDYAIAWTT